MEGAGGATSCASDTPYRQETSGSPKGVRVTIPIGLDEDDYVSMAANFVVSEMGGSEGETSLIQVVDLLATGQSMPACQRP